MKNLIVIIDLHCDATMPSGAQEFGGGNTYARNLVLGLLKEDCAFLYITRKKYFFLETKVLLSSQATLYRLDLGDFGADDKDKLQEYYEQALTQIAKILAQYPQEQYSLVFHSCYWQSGYLAQVFAERYHTYYVHTVLSNGKSKAAQGAVYDLVESRIHTEESVFQGAKYVICSSESERQDLIRLYGLSSDKLIVTGRWVDLRYRHPLYKENGAISTCSLGGKVPAHYLPLQLQSSPQRYTGASAWWYRRGFLYLGRIHKNKGIPEIVASWLLLYQKFGDNTPPLWIVGGSPPQIDQMRNYLGEQMPALYTAEQTSKLLWWGTLDPAGISTLLLKTMVLVMHSKYEAGGIVVLEAMSQGVPVIATPFGYAKNYIRDWQNGFLVPYGDIQGLKHRMEHFIYHPYLSSFLGQRARVDAEKVQRKWEFIQSHLRLYGFMPSESETSPEANEEDLLLNTISVYPHCAKKLDPAYLAGVVERWTGSKDIKIGPEQLNRRAAYHQWKITAQRSEMMLFAFEDLLCWHPLWNAGQGTPLLTKYQRVQMASFASVTRCFPTVLQAEPTLGLLLQQAYTDGSAKTADSNLLVHKFQLLDKLFYSNPPSGMGDAFWFMEKPFSLSSALLHLNRMATEMRSWAPQASQELELTIEKMNLVMESEYKTGNEIGISVLGLTPDEVFRSEELFSVSPQAILCKSTWGMSHAAFLLQVCETFHLPLEVQMCLFPTAQQEILKAWIDYFHAVRMLLRLNQIPETFML